MSVLFNPLPYVPLSLLSVRVHRLSELQLLSSKYPRPWVERGEGRACMVRRRLSKATERQGGFRVLYSTSASSRWGRESGDARRACLREAPPRPRPPPPAPGEKAKGGGQRGRPSGATATAGEIGDGASLLPLLLLLFYSFFLPRSSFDRCECSRSGGNFTRAPPRNTQH